MSTLQGLQRLGGGLSAGSVASWTYSSADNFATVAGADYFLDQINILKLGDSIGVHDTAGVFTDGFVSANDGSTITVSAKA
jgi:hypothetical protein